METAHEMEAVSAVCDSSHDFNKYKILTDLINGHLDQGWTNWYLESRLTF